MKVITDDVLNETDYLLYIHTPFCGTCHVARSMLEKIEEMHQRTFFYEMNASFYPEFMQIHKIESVPCLFIKKDGEVKEKIYAFRSVVNIYQYMLRYFPDWLTK